jgi:TolB protein
MVRPSYFAGLFPLSRAYKLATMLCAMKNLPVRPVTRILQLLLTLCCGGLACLARDHTPAIGLFKGHSDVGTVLREGTVVFDPSSKTYTLTGSGENMWFASDDFQFVWKKVTAKDIAISADLSFLGEGGNNHRKGVLMIRQSLDTDAAYADAALHGDGLTSLQARDQKGAVTHEVEANVSGPRRMRLEKRGDWFYLWTGSNDGDLKFAGGSMRVPLTGPFYIGIGVCAHDKNAIQKVAFTNVGISKPSSKRLPSSEFSTLQTIAVSSTDSRVSYVSTEPMSAPSWSSDGQTLLLNIAGRPSSVPLAGGAPQTAKNGPAPSTQTSRPSPDGKQTATIAWGPKLPHRGREATLSVTNVADQKTKFLIRFIGDEDSLGPDPWSPDSKRLAFVSYQDLRK